MSKRHYVPCRRCGCNHKNPASSSLCNKCGEIEYMDNLRIKEEIAELEREQELRE